MSFSFFFFLKIWWCEFWVFWAVWSDYERASTEEIRGGES